MSIFEDRRRVYFIDAQYALTHGNDLTFTARKGDSLILPQNTFDGRVPITLTNPKCERNGQRHFLRVKIHCSFSAPVKLMLLQLQANHHHSCVYVFHPVHLGGMEKTLGVLFLICLST